MRFMRAAMAVGAMATALASGADPSAAAAPPMPPERIVSLNLCTDQILLDLVPRSRIRALSHLAADASVSASAEKARGIPATRGAAEDVLRLDPDLVIAGAWSTPATVSLLERLGRRVLKVAHARDLAEIRTIIATMAEAVGAAEAGRRLVASFDHRLAAARPVAGPPLPTATLFGINGLTAGPGTLPDAMLEAAGFRNLADVLELSRRGDLSLEQLVARPPDLLVLSLAPEAATTVVAENLRHPALKALLARTRHVQLPRAYFLCGTHRVAEGIERLAAARRDIQRAIP